MTMRQIRNQAAALAALAVLASCSNDDSPTRTEPSPTGAGSTKTLQPETGRQTQDRPSSDHPRGLPPEPPRKLEESGTRPIAYGQGQTLHLGNRKIDTGLDFLSVAVTDDGAALTTIDGGIWFADGRTVERIGSTIALRVRPRSVSPGAEVMPPEWVITDTAGSLLAWLEYPGQRPDRPELVVYDSGSRVVLDRKPIEVVPDGGSATVLAIAGRAVFLDAQVSGPPPPGSVHRFDVDTGVLEPAAEAELAAERREVSRTLVVGPSAEASGVLHTENVYRGLNSVQRLTVNDSELEDLLDPHTGEQVKLRVPAGYESGAMWFLQWLDDTRFTLISGHSADDPSPRGDLLVCRITDGRCDVRLDRSTWPTVSTAPLLPGQMGGVGAELALGRAARTVLEEE